MGGSSYSVGEMTLEDIERQTNLLMKQINKEDSAEPSIIQMDDKDNDNDTDHTLTESDGSENEIENNFEHSSEGQDVEMLDSSKAEKQDKLGSKTDPSNKSLINEEASSSTTNCLSVEQQVALGKFVV